MLQKNTNNLIKEIAKFIAIGGICFIIEWTVYYLTLQYSQSLIWSKLFGVIIGTAAAYILNSLFTFKTFMSWQRIMRYTVLYTCTITINVVMNKYTVLTIEQFIPRFYALFSSFVFYTLVSSVLNFIGIKLFVLKK